MLIKRLLLFYLLFFSCIVYAEITSSTNQNDISEDSSMRYVDITTFVLGKTISSSTGFDLAIGDESRNVLLIERDEIESRGFTSIQEALQYQPLLTFYNSGFGENIDLRGQGEDANRAIKILVNRVPINLLDTSHGVTPYNNIDIEDIESIEIIPGGGAVVYGNGTRGGVVNIVTKKNMGDFARIVLKATSGEDVGLQGGTITVSGGKQIDNKLFVRGDISAGYTPGPRNTKGDGVKSNTNDNTKDVYVASQVLYDINENHKLDFNINYSHLWTKFPNGSLTMSNTKYLSFEDCDIISNCNRYLPSQYTGKDEVDVVTTSLNYSAKFSDALSFDALAFYQFSKLRYIDDVYLTNSGNPFNQTGSGFENQGGGLNLKLKHEIDSNIFIIGLDIVAEHSNRRNLIDHVITDTSSMWMGYIADTNIAATKLSDSLYIYDIVKFNKNWELGLGVRGELSTYWIKNNQYYDMNMIMGSAEMNLGHDDTHFNVSKNRFSYAAEITPNYKYSDTGNVYAKVELGFISPSAYQMINADKNQYDQMYENYYNGIKTEQYVTGEIGWKDEFGPTFFSATFFYTHTFDEIFVDNIEHGVRWRYGNLGETQRIGLELLGRQRFGDSGWVRLTEGFSYIYTNVLKANEVNAYLHHKQIPYVPQFKVVLNAEFDLFHSNNHLVSMFVNNAYYGSSKAMGCVGGVDTYGECDNSNKYQTVMNKGGYLLTDIGVNWRISDFGLSAGVRNVFDSFYVYYQRAYNYVTTMGRNYFVELRYDF